MKISKVCSIELLVLLVCLTCFSSSEGHAPKKARGYRGYRRRDVSQADDNGVFRRALKGWLSTPTAEPTFEPTAKSKDEKEEEEEEPVLEAAEKEDKVEAEEEEETDAPTSSPTVEETTEATTTEPTAIPMVAAKEDKNAEEEEEEETTDSPTGMPTVEQTTESPTAEPTDPPTAEPTDAPTAEPTDAPTAETTTSSTVAPTDYPTSIQISEANEFTVEPAVGGVTTSPPTTEDESSSTLSPTGSDANVPATPEGETTAGPTSTMADPYYVRLEPLYMTVSLSDGGFNEENFMDVLIAYMDYNMVRDLEYFESITYGISTFSQTTVIPNSVGRSQNTSATASPIVSNTTVHIHLLSATFSGTPTQPDLVITEYLEMLLENGELFQEYIDTQTQLDAKIYSVTLEFEETVQPTNVQDNTSSGQDTDPNAATTADGDPENTEEDEGNSIGQIVGITIGCFVALLWMVTLWGVQSRAGRS